MNDVDRRTIEEATRQGLEQLEQGLEGQRIADEGREKLEDALGDEIAIHPAVQKQLDAMAAEVRRSYELCERYLKESGLGPLQKASVERDLEQLRVAKVHTLAQRGGTVTILIHPNGESPALNWPVPLGLNGRTIVIPRGIPTRIPSAFLMLLEEAKQEHIAPIADANGNVVLTPMSFVSYPYSIIDTRQ